MHASVSIAQAIRCATLMHHIYIVLHVCAYLYLLTPHECTVYRRGLVVRGRTGGRDDDGDL